MVVFQLMPKAADRFIDRVLFSLPLVLVAGGRGTKKISSAQSSAKPLVNIMIPVIKKDGGFALRQKIHEKLRKHLILLGDTTGLKELQSTAGREREESCRRAQCGREEVF